METYKDLFGQNTESQYTTEGSTFISLCNTYRYMLARTWDKNLPVVMFMMLNPSTADAFKDDNTIRRCIKYAKEWGYGGIMVGNLFAFRSTDPNKLLQQTNPIGPDNMFWLSSMMQKCDKVVLAWGNSDIIKRMSKLYVDYFPLNKDFYEKYHYLELAKDGTPKHPLYLKSNLVPVKFEKMPNSYVF